MSFWSILGRTVVDGLDQLVQKCLDSFHAACTIFDWTLFLGDILADAPRTTPVAGDTC